MSRKPEGNALTITLVARSPAEEAQTRWWRPVSWKWPSFSPPPNLQILSWDDAASGSAMLTGAAALIVPPDDAGGSLYTLLDQLGERFLPAVVLHDPLGPATNGDESVIPLPSDADPAMIAGVLATLAHRQRAVDSLRTDLGVSQRFQGGLSGQIEMIHDELQLAASVQREFLPKALPGSPEFDVRVLFRPCGYVSGDIYDVQALDDRHIGFFVADAVGHGVPAALMTMVLCRCLHTVERDGGSHRIVPPARVMQRLNQDLIRRHGEGSRFATAVYGVIDRASRRVTLAGAGHPYPLRIRGSSVDRVETEGGLLGIDAGDEFTEFSFTLEDDELLVIYTDGFETAFPTPDVDEYGRRLPNRNYIERFAELARARRERGLTRAVDALTDQIDEQAGSLHQADDLTALVIAAANTDPLDRLISGDALLGAPAEAAPTDRAEARAPRLDP